VSWTTDLLIGLAEHLETAGIVDWRPPPATYSAPYAGPAVFFRQLPDAPDAAVALSVYAAPAGDGTADVTVGVQLLWRGGTDPTVVDGYSDAAWELLHEAGPLTLGQDGHRVHLARIWRQSTADLQTDPSGRWLRSDNYYVIASRPTIHRPD